MGKFRVDCFYELKSNDDWKEEKDKSGIQVYSKPSGGSIDNFLKTMEINAPIEEVIAFYNNLDGMKEIDDRIETISIGN